MLWAKNQAMASFGLMAVIGEISCLLFALVFMTAYLAVREDRREPVPVIVATPTAKAKPRKKRKKA
jgi:predicted RND superfamily exporter protein